LDVNGMRSAILENPQSDHDQPESVIVMHQNQGKAATINKCSSWNSRHGGTSAHWMV
jgi:hypothetical protein